MLILDEFDTRVEQVRGDIYNLVVAIDGWDDPSIIDITNELTINGPVYFNGYRGVVKDYNLDGGMAATRLVIRTIRRK